MPDGTTDPEEILNRSQTWITSAGYKNSYPFKRLIELLVQSIIDPDEVMILGGTYKIPVYEGLLDMEFINQLKMEDTYKEDSFEREFLSKWSGDAENAFFSAEKFDRQRTILQFETEEDKKAKDAYYVIGVDVGRVKCTTEATIFKVTPHAQGIMNKSLVNIYTYDSEHFEDQCINLKKLKYKYNARIMVIDGNGLIL